MSSTLTFSINFYGKILRLHISHVHTAYSALLNHTKVKAFVTLTLTFTLKIAFSNFVAATGIVNPQSHNLGPFRQAENARGDRLSESQARLVVDVLFIYLSSYLKNHINRALWDHCSPFSTILLFSINVSFSMLRVQEIEIHRGRDVAGVFLSCSRSPGKSFSEFLNRLTNCAF